MTPPTPDQPRCPRFDTWCSTLLRLGFRNQRTCNPSGERFPGQPEQVSNRGQRGWITPLDLRGGAEEGGRWTHGRAIG